MAIAEMSPDSRRLQQRLRQQQRPPAMAPGITPTGPKQQVVEGPLSMGPRLFPPSELTMPCLQPSPRSLPTEAGRHRGSRLWLAAALIALPVLGLMPAAMAQTLMNPYHNSYNSWNQQFPGYQNGGRNYRGEIERMNPYGPSYRAIERQQRNLFRWR